MKKYVWAIFSWGICIRNFKRVLKLCYASKSMTNGRTDEHPRSNMPLQLPDECPRSNMPLQLLWSWGHNKHYFHQMIIHWHCDFIHWRHCDIVHWHCDIIFDIVTSFTDIVTSFIVASFIIHWHCDIIHWHYDIIQRHCDVIHEHVMSFIYWHCDIIHWWCDVIHEHCNIIDTVASFTDIVTLFIDSVTSFTGIVTSSTDIGTAFIDTVTSFTVISSLTMWHHSLTYKLDNQNVSASNHDLIHKMLTSKQRRHVCWFKKISLEWEQELAMTYFLYSRNKWFWHIGSHSFIRK